MLPWILFCGDGFIISAFLDYVENITSCFENFIGSYMSEAFACAVINNSINAVMNCFLFISIS